MVTDDAADVRKNFGLLKAYYHPLFKVFHIHYLI